MNTHWKALWRQVRAVEQLRQDLIKASSGEEKIALEELTDLHDLERQMFDILIEEDRKNGKFEVV